jgi:hypothetical protein
MSISESAVDVVAAPNLEAVYHAAGPWITQTIYVAAELGLADLLAAGPASADHLAERTGSDPSALYRFCRALAAFGMLEERPGRLFALAPAGRVLAADAPGGFRDGVRLQSGAVFRAWGEVLHTVRTGEPGFVKAYGMDYFAYLDRNPDEVELLNKAMAATMPAAIAAADLYPFDDCATVVDVGGGDGSLLCSVLARRPKLRATLQEIPQTVEQARARIAEAGFADRVEVVGRSFFDGVVPGADVYILSRVLHDWDDEHASAILRQVRAAMPSTSRLVIIDSVLRPEEGGMLSVLGDLLMLVVLGGRERTEPEWRDLLAAAGFSPRRVLDDGGSGVTRGHSVIEAFPA